VYVAAFGPSIRGSSVHSEEAGDAADRDAVGAQQGNAAGELGVATIGPETGVLLAGGELTQMRPLALAEISRHEVGGPLHLLRP